ncbi:hypothetical protein [Mesorhizobium sp.]|jgi:hypothetical protein|uniref:hypothetical protein n=1 Tax=Mesorhizobium sp. TaxID=1871066 RepID=UPI0025DF6C8C|nr:hypothetical protein [Mesorhizobium sp.]
MIYDVHRVALTLQWREQDVAISIATSGNTLPVNRLGGNGKTLFATWVANGHGYALAVPTCRRFEWSAHDKTRRLGKTEAAL